MHYSGLKNTNKIIRIIMKIITRIIIAIIIITLIITTTAIKRIKINICYIENTIVEKNSDKINIKRK